MKTTCSMQCMTVNHKMNVLQLQIHLCNTVPRCMQLVSWSLYSKYIYTSLHCTFFRCGSRCWVPWLQLNGSALDVGIMQVARLSHMINIQWHSANISHTSASYHLLTAQGSWSKLQLVLKRTNQGCANIKITNWLIAYPHNGTRSY